MEAKIITYATPVFFLLIAVEIIASRLMRRDVYRADDAINSLSLGVISQVAAVFGRAFTVAIYKFIYDNFSFMSLPPDSVAVWIFALFAYDFCYYWLHRLGHELTFLWAAHVVHHQSEEYNLSTALRQTSTGMFFGWIFYVPLILVGVPPAVFAVVALIDLLYQFWIHTQLIDRMGWFDRVFASPSNHRVHHAVNDKYLDKNYGGMLIIWDRMFGTFVDEDDKDPPLYGTRSQLRSWNPFWANVEVYAVMFHDFVRTGTWRDKFAVLTSRTGWRPGDIKARWPKPEFQMDRPKFFPNPSRALLAYGTVQFGVLLVAGIHFLQVQKGAELGPLAVYACWIVASMSSLGIVLESRRDGVWYEVLRWVLTGAGVAMTGSWFMAGIVAPGLAMTIISWAAISVIWICLVRLTGGLTNQSGMRPH
jgi:sterol desaturase/sphingolipid hydroxylase (fatty acid hydroxylase superfamily)